MEKLPTNQKKVIILGVVPFWLSLTPFISETVELCQIYMFEKYTKKISQAI